MNTMAKVAIGGLLHDVGKLLSQDRAPRSCAERGYDFLRKQAYIQDDEILDQVRYHHTTVENGGAAIPSNSLSYITHMAEKIASASDRRDTHDHDDGTVRGVVLESIFNHLNGNDQVFYYDVGELQNAVLYPQRSERTCGAKFYDSCVAKICSKVKEMEPTVAYINSLLEVLESCISYIPASESKGVGADISLFDHSRLTAALGCCIYLYLTERGEQDFWERLVRRAAGFYHEKAFLLYSMDISGIQDFIYTISSDKALKTLRARSFYLDILMEHLVDMVLSQSGLSRVNCIYCGGGHAYLLLPNTTQIRTALDIFEAQVNQWFMDWFGTALYLASGYAACSADDLQNEPAGAYALMFRQVSNHISARKVSRYSAREILALNQKPILQGMRECSVCRRTDHLGEDDRCTICSSIERFSNAVQSKEFFAVTETRDKEQILPLPGGAYLVAEDRDGLHRRIKNDGGYLRSYCKNNVLTGRELVTHIWVGDYENGGDFHELASGSEGIRRLAVLRADVDNLGQAFVSGFVSEKYGHRYVSLSRTAIFSRQLALFFKRHINDLLKNGTYFLSEMDKPSRKATIVYAGGDDLFIIGAWDDILGFAVDLHDALDRFTEGTLALSAGIGLYPEKYPVAAMARQTGALEDASKGYPGKNAITLFDSSFTFSWDQYINQVLGEKFQLIQSFFHAMPGYGKSFLYRLLELMRARSEKINLARYAYLLARMEPKENAGKDEKNLYQEFSRKMYLWMKDGEQCRQAMAAIMIYIYSIREQAEGDRNED